MRKMQINQKTFRSSGEQRFEQEDGFANRPSFLTNFCNASLLSAKSLAETSRLIYFNDFQAIVQTHMAELIKINHLMVIDACLRSAWFLHAKPLVGSERAKWMWIKD